MEGQRKIIHIDMDAFYASVEQRDNPSLRGKPVAVGGSPDKRGVVAAASYEARAYGVHSAMPMKRAVTLCPQLQIVRGRRGVYSQISQQLNDLYHEYTDLVEPLSLDECFLDVTENKKGIRYASSIAKELRRRIRKQFNLTASAGVAPNKFLAKLASDYRKPDGLTVVTPEAIDAFIRDLPVKRLWGVGPATARKFASLGITTIGQIRQWTEEDLRRQFGKHGSLYYKLCRGIDDRPVMPDTQRKSVSQERTFNYDIVDPERLRDEVADLCARVALTLQKKELKGTTVTLKARYSDFTTISRSLTLPYPIGGQSKLLEVALQLLSRTEAGSRPMRLLGVGISNLLDKEHVKQLLLFDL